MRYPQLGAKSVRRCCPPTSGASGPVDWHASLGQGAASIAGLLRLRRGKIVIGFLLLVLLVGRDIRVLSADNSNPGLLQLANAYRETERTLAQFPPTSDQDIAETNRTMDKVAIHFFSRDYQSAIRVMHSVILQRARPAAASIGDQLALALNRRPDRLIVSQGDDAWPEDLKFEQLYPLEVVGADSADITVKVFRRDDPQRLEALETGLKAVRDQDGEWTAAVPAKTWQAFWEKSQRSAGIYEIELHSPDGIVGRSLPLEVLAESLPDTCRNLKAKADKLAESTDVVNPAMAHWQRRLSLLTDESSSARLSRWALGINPMLKQLEEELNSIQAGNDPYRDRSGDMWMSFRVGEKDIPCRLYRPPMLTAKEAHPAMIVLHGAGGNEHMFMETLGAGRIKVLAEKHEFIVISPATPAIMSSQEKFLDFLGEVQQIHAVDPEMIFVIGHSMGAFTATQLGSRYPKQIRGMALIAGGPRWGLARPEFPRTRVYLAEHDKIVSSAAILKSVAGCQRQGIPIDSLERPHLGHVLVVGAVLDEAVEWLLADVESG